MIHLINNDDPDHLFFMKLCFQEIKGCKEVTKKKARSFPSDRSSSPSDQVIRADGRGCSKFELNLTVNYEL